jgi:hypothetical protein
VKKTPDWLIFNLGWLIMCATSAFVSWLLLHSVFDLSYINWFAISIVAIMYVRAGLILEKIYDGLTKPKQAVRITTLS